MAASQLFFAFYGDSRVSCMFPPGFLYTPHIQLQHHPAVPTSQTNPISPLPVNHSPCPLLVATELRGHRTSRVPTEVNHPPRKGLSLYRAGPLGLFGLIFFRTKEETDEHCT